MTERLGSATGHATQYRDGLGASLPAAMLLSATLYFIFSRVF